MGENLQQLQLIEQNLQHMAMQRQQFQSQGVEIESALSEIKEKDSCYKIIGNIMVLSEKKEVQTDLETKKQTIELRIKTIEKQEQKLKDKAEKLREEVLKEMKNDK